jgi:hypothetical protein
MDGQIHRQNDRETGRQIDRQMDGRMDGQNEFAAIFNVKGLIVTQ